MAKTGLSPAPTGTYLKDVEMSADAFGRPNVDPPAVVDQDNVTLYSFTVDTDKMTIKMEIPSDYAGGDMQFAVMWTNDGGVDDNGKYVKWQLDYQTAGTGDAVSGNHANSPKSVEEAYDSDSGWIEQDTAYVAIAAADFAGKTHIFIKLSAVTPVGDPLTCDPHLICMCYMYTARWGRKP